MTTTPSQLINSRKNEHLDLCLNDPQIDRQSSQFDEIRLMPNALPEINFDEVDTSTFFLGKPISMPLIISSMTGGSDSQVQKINKNLALAAEACQIPMAVGSQRVMMVDPAAVESFDLRKWAPTTPLIANIGAVQLNHGLGIKECQQAIDTLEADGLFLHLNALQEVIQPEGDTNFHDLKSKIKLIQAQLSKPLLIKEVGCGFSPKNLEDLHNMGVNYVDLAGRGGTSWSKIEGLRHRDNESLGELFQDWGLSSIEILRNYAKLNRNMNLIASGGMRSGLDLTKSLVLGAKMGGMALPFLQAATVSVDEVIKTIKRIQKELQTTMFLLGVKNIAELQGNHALIFKKESTW
ncbi:MAG: type 2 isopentenyl-diphosphate Delta-isomerase [Lentisphaeria bacterium]|nr:type 2 isopentenyl-diphosphate Delta-isomerase [Lentisphaeria bacterium]